MKTHLSAEFKLHASLYIYTSQIQRGISLKFSILCIVHQKHMTLDYMYQHSPSMWNLPMMAWYFLTPANGLPGAEFPPDEKVGMVTPTLVLPECFLEFPLSAMLSSLGVLSMAQSKAPEVPTMREFFTVQYWSAKACPVALGPAINWKMLTPLSAARMSETSWGALFW